jgi:hypothetical protein
MKVIIVTAVEISNLTLKWIIEKGLAQDWAQRRVLQNMTMKFYTSGEHFLTHVSEY